MRQLPLLMILTVLLTGCAELQQLRDRSDLQQQELERLRTERNSWRDDYYSLRTQYEDLSQRYTSDMEDLRIENNRLRTSLSEREEFLESEVQRLTREVGDVETELGTASGQRDQALRDLEAARDNLSTTTARAEALGQQIAALRSDLNLAEEDLTQYDSQLEQAISGSEDLSSRLQNLRSERDGFRDEVERLRSENDRLSAAAGSVQFSQTQLDRISSYISEQFEGIEGPKPTVSQDPGLGVIVTFVSGDLFESGSTVLTESAARSVTIVGLAIDQLPETQIEVIGHTDNEPINTLAFRDNWQLSASRAENVLRTIVEEGGVDPARIRFAAQGEHQPLQSNDSLEGRRANRRVEIVVKPRRGS